MRSICVCVVRHGEFTFQSVKTFTTRRMFETMSTGGGRAILAAGIGVAMGDAQELVFSFLCIVLTVLRIPSALHRLVRVTTFRLSSTRVRGRPIDCHKVDLQIWGHSCPMAKLHLPHVITMWSRHVCGIQACA